MVGSVAPFGLKLLRQELDILNPISISTAFDRYTPKTVIHLAANVNMLDCQSRPEQAYLTNVVGTYHIAAACRARGIKLVYLSTCALFDGQKATAYNEHDTTQPPSVYGRTKLISEQICKDLISNPLIIRTGWLFGGGHGDEKKFVRVIFEAMKQGQEVKAVTDRYGSPTYIPDLWRGIHQLLEKNMTGTFNVVNQGTASYFDMAETTKQLGGFDTTIHAVLAEEQDNALVPRATMEALEPSESVTMRSWQEAMQEYVHGLKESF